MDDQEEVLNVRILPARPINEEREYAGREGNAEAYSSLAHLAFILTSQVFTSVY